MKLDIAYLASKTATSNSPRGLHARAGGVGLDPHVRELGLEGALSPSSSPLPLEACGLAAATRLVQVAFGALGPRGFGGHGCRGPRAPLGLVAVAGVGRLVLVAQPVRFRHERQPLRLAQLLPHAP
jgi:hypothetical protein